MARPGTAGSAGERTRPSSLDGDEGEVVMPGPAVDGATLRQWRVSRGWDVSRLARELTKTADEPLATVRGLMHMINAWERGARRPSERHWLLYLQVFSDCANGEPAQMRALAEEQAALRRVAALVARPASPDEVFAAVTEEAARVLHADTVGLSRYDQDGAHRLLSLWAGTGIAAPAAAGKRFDPAELARMLGTRASADVPVTVQGRVWGVMSIGSSRGPLPAGAADRLAGFAELAGTAIASAEAQAALTASLALIIAAAGHARRRG